MPLRFGDATVGVPKVESGKARIADLNTDVKVIPFQERLTSENVDRIFGLGSGYAVEDLLFA